MRTADGLFDAVMLDMPLSAGQCDDFGVKDTATYAAYQRAVRGGEVTADQLHEAATSGTPGKDLSALIGVEITTIWEPIVLM